MQMLRPNLEKCLNSLEERRCVGKSDAGASTECASYCSDIVLEKWEPQMV